MAINWINVNHVTRQNFLPYLVDQVYLSNPVFNVLRNRGLIRERGGQDIREPVLMATFPGQWVGPHDVIDVSPREFIKSIVLDWANYVVPGVISDIEIRINGGEHRVLDLVAATLQNMQMSIQENLATHLFDTSPTPPAKSMSRFIDAISDTTTYGGINPATDPWWKSVVIDLGNVDLTFPRLNDAILRTSFGNTSPDLIVCSKPVWNKLWVNAQSSQRFPEGDEVLVGWEFIRIGRARVTYDDHCPLNRVYGLNTDFIRLIVHEDANFRFEGWRVPHNQMSRVGFIVFMGQLLVNGRRYHFRIDNVNPS